jgi:carboxyl-terminal processing protease
VVRWLVLPSLVLTACAAPDGSGDVLAEVWEIVRERFHDPELNGVDWPAALARARAALGGERSPAALSTATNGMLSELATSHTAFFTREDPAYYVFVELFWEALDPARRERFFPDGPPRLPGIGILTEPPASARAASASLVRGVLEGSPAAAAGIARGDRMLTVEGEPFQPVKSFRGRIGRPTRMRVQQAGDPSDRELTLVPEALSPRALFLRALRTSAHIVERNGARLAYAHLWSYAGEELQEMLRELLLTGPLSDADGLVLDLRGGFGGANPEYLNLFRRDLPELTLMDRDGTANKAPASWTKPVVLLVDEGTTSGKEVFAHGFRREQRGQIVGTRTAGAVMGGSAFLMHDGSLLYLAVLDVLVDGERLEGRGVEPDVVVPFSRETSTDSQLERALDVLAAEVTDAGARAR